MSDREERSQQGAPMSQRLWAVWAGSCWGPQRENVGHSLSGPMLVLRGCITYASAVHSHWLLIVFRQRTLGWVQVAYS